MQAQIAQSKSDMTPSLPKPRLNVNSEFVQEFTEEQQIAIEERDDASPDEKAVKWNEKEFNEWLIQLKSKQTYASFESVKSELRRLESKIWFSGLTPDE